MIKTTEPSDHMKMWGVVRYAAGSGRAPDEDAAAFDGWYRDREDALAVAEDWAKRYPQWAVVLMRSDEVLSVSAAFAPVCNRPLTYRESALVKVVMAE